MKSLSQVINFLQYHTRQKKNSAGLIVNRPSLYRTVSCAVFLLCATLAYMTGCGNPSNHSSGSNVSSTESQNDKTETAGMNSTSTSVASNHEDSLSPSSEPEEVDESPKPQTLPPGKPGEMADSVWASLSDAQKSSIIAIERLKETCFSTGLLSCKDWDDSATFTAWKTVAQSSDQFIEYCKLPKLDMGTGHYITNNSQDLAQQIGRLRNPYLNLLSYASGRDSTCMNRKDIFALRDIPDVKKLVNPGEIISSSPDYTSMREEEINRMVTQLRNASVQSPKCLSTCLKNGLVGQIMSLNGEKAIEVPAMYLNTNGKVVPGGVNKDQFESAPNIKLCKSVCGGK